MKITKYLSACILLTIAPASAFSQEITESAPNYYNSRNDFLSAPASVYYQGLIGF